MLLKLREESKLFGKKATRGDGLSEWQKKMNDAAFALCMGTLSLTLNRGELLEKATEKVDNDGFNYKKGKSRSKTFRAASTGDSKVKRAKLDSDERRILIGEGRVECPVKCSQPKNSRRGGGQCFAVASLHEVYMNEETIH